MNRKILVVTGGGADGAVTVGRLKALGMPNYKFGVGISTGSLIVPHALLGNIDKLKDFYLNVKQKDITEDSAFKKNGKLNITNTIQRTIRSFAGGRNTIGSSKNLLKTIKKGFTIEDYTLLNKMNKTAFVGCYSMNTEENNYFSSLRLKYFDFVEFMWASANPPIVFSTLKKVYNGKLQEWVDGGVKEVMPICFALGLANAGDEIDVFMHRPKRKKIFKNNIKNIVDFAGRVISSIFKHSEEKDIKLGIEMARHKKVKLNIFYMGYEINNNSLIFKENEMMSRYELGKKWITKEHVESYDFR